MTHPEPPEFYPQYCFHLSPTVGKWCHLRAADVVALSSHPGFEGQNIFFHLNHPIKWVRVSGIVTAIDEFAGRRAYTIDDSSGTTMECQVLLSEIAESNDEIKLETKPHASAPPAKIIVKTSINTGDIIDVKGTIRVYRNMKQVKAEKIVLVRTTEQEVQFWEKVVKLRREVLDRPWVLDPRVVRRCRKEEEGDERHRARKRTRSPSVAVGRTAEGRAQPRPVVTGLEKRVKIPRTAEATRNSEEDHGAQRKDTLHPNLAVTGLEKANAKIPKATELDRHPMKGHQEGAELAREKGTLPPRPTRTGLERRATTQRTADENSPCEPGTARDTSERPPPKPKPPVTGLEKGRSYVKRHQDARSEPGLEIPLARRDNVNVSALKPQPPITGLEKSSAILRTAKRPVEPVMELQQSRSENSNLEPHTLVTGLEKKHKTKTKKPILVTGQYSAL